MSVHVDDVFAIATEDRLLDEVDAALAAAFETETYQLTRHYGPKLSYLKMNIEHHEDGSVTVDQSLYISKVISDWGHGRGPSTAGQRLIDDDEAGLVDTSYADFACAER